MRFLNFGSLNIDITLSVEHIASPGETVKVLSLDKNIGGKGLNQSTALARAGAEVFHAGCVGSDGSFLIDHLNKNGVNTQYIRELNCETGKAFIEVAQDGQNSIAVFGGANLEVEHDLVNHVITDFGKGDILLLQNEISSNSFILHKAREVGMTIVLNPSPTDGLDEDDLAFVDIFILNESECAFLTGESNTEKMPNAMLQRFPGSKTVLTLGENGAVYADGKICLHVPARKVHAVDTTAAGDTFTGFFLQDFFTHNDPERALKTAATAAAIAVTRPGAAESIPFLIEL